MTDSASGIRNLDAVTGADIQTVTFATSKGFGRGYDPHEVDSFVVRCAAVVDRLRERLQAHEAEIARLNDRIERDSRSNEVAHAISVLTTAQQTADRTVAQADEYSAKVMAEARDLYEDTRRNAATLEQETEEKSRHVYDEALARAAALERETLEQVDQLTLTAQTTQKELDGQTAYLRTLRDATRTQIETFLEGLLNHVAEEYGRAHPMAAEAANTANSASISSRRPKRSNRLAGRGGVTANKSVTATPRVAGLAPVRRVQGPSNHAPSGQGPLAAMPDEGYGPDAVDAAYRSQ